MVVIPFFVKGDFQTGFNAYKMSQQLYENLKGVALVHDMIEEGRSVGTWWTTAVQVSLSRGCQPLNEILHF